MNTGYSSLNLRNKMKSASSKSGEYIDLGNILPSLKQDLMHALCCINTDFAKSRNNPNNV